MAYIMENMTVKDMEEALKNTKTVIIPVGIVEQHGYHLPLSTDIYNATEVPKRVADRINAVIAPVVPYCYSGGELLGTVNVSPQVFSLLIMDICSEFARMGFKNIVIFLGHGGTDNKIALKSALQMLLRRNPHLKDITLSLVECWDLSPTWHDAMTKGAERDFHAGWVETSLMMYWKPELVRDAIVMDEPEVARMMRTDQDWFETSEKNVDHEFVIPRTFQRKEIKIGVMGFPGKASRELGEKISKEMEDGLVEYINMLNEHEK
ncbi:MAG TPA: creatininase family protein [Clostridiaceae bacterium]|nr:creatininase family protein [Clostridiaceae bacterium]